MKYLILGNGAAGITAAGKLRELRKDDEITVVSKENTPVYTKCMLPDYVGGKMSREKLFIRDMKFYASNRIELILNKRAEKVDTSSRRVVLETGEAVHYDKLLIAVGGTPSIPPIEGLSGVKYHILNSISDADTIKASAFKGGRAVIVGSGLTGIELGFALKNHGMQVYIVERSDRILPQQLDDFSSSVLVDYIRQEGINLLTDTVIEEIVNNGDVQSAGEKGGGTARLNNGQQLPFDMFVISTGTRPDTKLVADTGIKCARGILVDEYMRTTEENVYAAGDVSEMLKKPSGQFVSSYVWPNAMAQGKCAAFNMAEEKQEFSPSAVMYNSVQLRDIPFISMGMIDTTDSNYETMVNYDNDRRLYKKLIIKDNIVMGMVMLGDTGSANAISSFIRGGKDVSEIKHILLDGDMKSAPKPAAMMGR